MEKQRDKLARRAARKLAAASGLTGEDNLEGVERELFCGVLKLDQTLVAILNRSRVVERNVRARPSP